MTICLCQQSAVECLREADARAWAAVPLSQRGDAPQLTLHATDIEALGSSGYGFLSKPVHVLVAHASERRLVKNVCCHMAPKGISPRRMLQMPNGVLSESSELCLLHEASVLPLPQLVELGYEFCGSYRMRPGETAWPPLA